MLLPYNSLILAMILSATRFISCRQTEEWVVKNNVLSEKETTLTLLVKAPGKCLFQMLIIELKTNTSSNWFSLINWFTILFIDLKDILNKINRYKKIFNNNQKSKVTYYTMTLQKKLIF